MKVTKRQLKNIIKEELEAALYEEQQADPNKAKGIVGIALSMLPQGAPIRSREPQGYIYSGLASVTADPYGRDTGGTVGIKLSNRATEVSPGGGSATNMRVEPTEIPAQMIQQIERQAWEHRGLKQALKKHGYSLGDYDDSAQFKFKFRGHMNRESQFGGYIIEPA